MRQRFVAAWEVTAADRHDGQPCLGPRRARDEVQPGGRHEGGLDDPAYSGASRSGQGRAAHIARHVRRSAQRGRWRRAPGFVAILAASSARRRHSAFDVGCSRRSTRCGIPRRPAREGRRQVGDERITLRFFGGCRTSAAPGIQASRDISDGIASLRGVAARSSARYDYSPVEFPDGGERRGILYARPGFFEVLGVKPRVGRLWTPDDIARGDVAIVSDRLWRRRFNNRQRVDGATVEIGDNEYKIIGVMPPRTEFSDASDQDIWIPNAAPDTTGGDNPIVRTSRRHSRARLSVQKQLNELCRRWTKQFLTGEAAAVLGAAGVAAGGRTRSRCKTTTKR